MKDRIPLSPVSGSCLYIEELFAEYIRDPSSVPPEWHGIFSAWRDADPFAANPRTSPEFVPPSIFAPNRTSEGCPDCSREMEVALLQDRLDQMVRAYRVRGHMVAGLDPLGRPRPGQVELDPSFYGFTDDDMKRTFSTRTIYGTERESLARIIERLRNTYCRSIGVQFMHINSLPMKEWLQERMEGTENRVKLTEEESGRVLSRLIDAVTFEEFIRKKFTGAKSFSLEGAETLIPLLDTAIEKAHRHGTREIVLAMAHRGRLNVLSNIVGKSASEIFREFADEDAESFVGSGDVKYHLGYSSDYATASGSRIHLTLAFNPSHLEFVNTVAMGRVRAKQDAAGDTARERIMGIVIHGDGAFAGEGVVAEALNLSELSGYTTGGTLHIVVNNQIAFTARPEEGRSTLYATDMARMLEIPVFHVNGEDPEAVMQVVNLAMDYHCEFKRDVVIDMYAFRRWGHNEGDEPSFTHPVMYREIERRPTVVESYLENLLSAGRITRNRAERIIEERKAALENELEASKDLKLEGPDAFAGIWEGYRGGPEEGPDPKTAIEHEMTAMILESITRVPPDFHLHPRLERLMRARREMAAGTRPIDWGTAEALALGSLSLEGHPVRLTGQDSARGTFSHRHAVLHDYEDERRYLPLSNLAPDQARIEVINSPLSEAGVLGFEYGYSLDTPNGLIIWEAQFGDFANAAQVVIDQFIAAAEAKWSRLSGIVLLLPHGLEGMGPEHSSARLERFLLLGANENIRIVAPSTSAQYFHILRRQVKSSWRKPLIVMTPKSLLRNPDSFSPLEDFTGGHFRRIIDDPAGPSGARRLLLSSGKIYHTLRKRREEAGRDEIRLARFEELYPLAGEIFPEFLSRYEGLPVTWVQEEPENMGAWRYIMMRAAEAGIAIEGIARPESSTPATGSKASHLLEEEAILGEIFGGGS